MRGTGPADAASGWSIHESTHPVGLRPGIGVFSFNSLPLGRVREPQMRGTRETGGEKGGGTARLSLLVLACLPGRLWPGRACSPPLPRARVQAPVFLCLGHNLEVSDDKALCR